MTREEIFKITTPAFVFDVEKLKNKISYMRRAFGKRIKLCYAIKTNPFLVRELIPLVDCFEVCSPGEYRICKRLRVPKEKIVLSGVYKEETDVFGVVKDCGKKAVYTVESLSQLCLLSRAAKYGGVALPLLLRLSCGNQFGMDEAVIENIVSRRGELPLELIGVQYYSGTQKRAEKAIKEIDYLKSFVEKLKEKYGFCALRIEYGAGLRVNYFTEDKTDYDLLPLAAALNGLSSDEIVLEAGRYIAAECGDYYTKIVDLKRNGGTNFCIADGGINHLNYYGQTMAMKRPFTEYYSPSDEENKITENWTVCGSLCTSADVLIKNYPIAGASVGDVIRFKNAGAYSVTEGIYLFLSRDMPNIYLKTADGTLALVRGALHTDEINCSGV